MLGPARSASQSAKSAFLAGAKQLEEVRVIRPKVGTTPKPQLDGIALTLGKRSARRAFVS